MLSLLISGNKRPTPIAAVAACWWVSTSHLDCRISGGQRPGLEISSVSIQG
jgi:hypothetical protein